ncbi:dipeptide ABC transporter ATP-binding protein [Homoserinibacter sp. YIM 151385]|uniref:dipeptide ABC transporter ATP-binding protein n=1 Tax=Homoserinibacter sp. YIM 151385 TaxID=2985506 RepID=UPI0022F034A1|nr:ABC transporter ATP-binding protein [Homoserinibacter sp. YIM 151385]WBU38969.1 ABC transporter ATP-binding protein [Homoserinibacter sp. YIM 151385]
MTAVELQLPERLRAGGDAVSPPARTLEVEHLAVGFRREGGVRPVVQDVSFRLEPGRCLAIVGESGSGKSVTARSLVGLTGQGAVVEAATLRLGDEELRGRSAADWRRLRGAHIGFVLQDALVSLDPLRPVGREIDEALRLHGWGGRADRRRRVLELLRSVGVPEPEVRAGQRPDELSGGLRQRALIASAIALDPGLLVADEPTTALDVTVQAQVLDLLEAAKDRGTSIILISHDLSVVSRLADEVLVIRGGEVVEQGEAGAVLADPQHPYTRALIAAVPGAATRGARLVPASGDAASPAEPAVARTRSGEAVLEARGLVKRFRRRGGSTQLAVADVGFELRRGETLGIVGESGSGKSTTGRIVLGLERPDAGEVRLLGEAWTGIPERRRRARRRRITTVVQDPLSSFDPRWNVERILLDALPAGGAARSREARVDELLAAVGLPAQVRRRFPLTLSGGQRQRVAIARALAPEPEIIVLDEAVSALDVSIQAQILDLLVDLQRERGLAYVFITHDLGVVAHLADRVLVMQGGRVVEQGDVEDVFERPQDPYTRELIGSIPAFDPGARARGARP